LRTRWLVDSDVLVDFLRGRAEAVAWVKEHQAELAVSPITVAELYVGARSPSEEERLTAFLALLAEAPLTAQEARRAGQLRRQFWPSHGVGLADALIAATVLSQGLSLATLNLKHFPMLPGLEPPYRKP
jgi:predicted nucleic acid-binding protein